MEQQNKDDVQVSEQGRLLALKNQRDQALNEAAEWQAAALTENAMRRQLEEALKEAQAQAEVAADDTEE